MCHFYLLWLYIAKNPSKIENKTQPSLCLQTWLQQNLRISTNQKYRIYMDVFFATGRFEDLTFWRPDVLKTWRFVKLTFCGCTVLHVDLINEDISHILERYTFPMLWAVLWIRNRWILTFCIKRFKEILKS